MGGVGRGKFRDGAVMWEEFDCFCHSLIVILGYIFGVASLVIQGSTKVTSLHYMLGEGETVTWTLKNEYFGSGRFNWVSIKIK